MGEYTRNDIIVYPTSKKAKNCIGKMVYFAASPSECLSYANSNNSDYCSILRGINAAKNCPFLLNSGFWDCIILKKEESKLEYTPFKSREEFLNYTESSLAHQISSFGGIFLKDNDYHMITEILNDGVVIGSNHLATTWKDVLDRYTFLDGTPCGKLRENE